MKNHSSNRAILVLEAPWELDFCDSNRVSVRHFIDGIGKLAGDTEVYHANFYDKSSFKKALECLCKQRFENTIVYIAAHGYKKKINNAVSISDLMFMVGEKSKDYNITGLMLGSCFVGENTTTMQVYLEGTNMAWMSGYSSKSTWLEGTFIDCAILASMLNLDEEDYTNIELIVETLGISISGFSESFCIGEDYEGDKVRLRDSIQFVVQQRGRGHRAKLVTDKVFQVHSLNQI